MGEAAESVVGEFELFTIHRTHKNVVALVFAWAQPKVRTRHLYEDLETR